VSDIFREVEEDVRREKFDKFWKAWGNTLIVAGVLVFAGIGGWQYWQHHEQQEREKFASQFIAAQRISSPRDAAAAMSDLSKNTSGGYAKLARLAQAGAMLASGQQKDAIDLYKQIAKDDTGPVGMVARLRAAWALADSAPRTELATLLEPLNTQGNAWREDAQEVLAYADYRAFDTKSALAKYTELSVNPDAPDALRTRAKAMVSFLKNGGGANFGTVPAEAPPVPPAAAAPTAPAAAAPAALAPAKK